MIILIDVVALFPVLITPPRIPTGFLPDFNNFSKKAFFHIYTFPSYWTPSGLLLDSYWTPTGLKQISQTYNLQLLTPNHFD